MSPKKKKTAEPPLSSDESEYASELDEVSSDGSNYNPAPAAVSRRTRSTKKTSAVSTGLELDEVSSVQTSGDRSPRASDTVVSTRTRRFTALPDDNQDSARALQSAETLQSRTRLDSYQTLPDGQSTNVQRFDSLVQAGLCEKRNAIDYNPQRPRARHVLDLDIFLNESRRPRDFQVQSVTLDQVQRVGEDEMTDVYDVVVSDHNEDAAPEVRLFRIKARANRPSVNISAIPENCALDRTVCRDEDAARELGDIVCKVMNRTPVVLPLNEWNSPAGGKAMPPAVIFVEVISLLTWDNEFDLGQLHPDWIGGTGDRSLYGSKIRDYAGARQNLLQAGLTFLSIFTNTGRTKRVESAYIPLNDIRTDMILEDAGFQIPKGIWFSENVQPQEGDGSRDYEAAFTLMRWGYNSVVGLCGTTEQIRSSFDESISRYLVDPTLRRSSGSFNEGSFYYPVVKAPDHAGFLLQPSAKVTSMIFATAQDKQDGNHMEHHSPDLTVHIHRFEPILHAYVHQQGIDALASQKTLLNAILAMMNAADSVDRGEISEDDVKQSHCSCHNNSDKAKREHVCMRCNLPILCNLLARTEDNRLLCRACVLAEQHPRRSLQFPPDTVIPDSQEVESDIDMVSSQGSHVDTAAAPTDQESVNDTDMVFSSQIPHVGPATASSDDGISSPLDESAQSLRAPHPTYGPTYSREVLLNNVKKLRAILNPTSYPGGLGKYCWLEASDSERAKKYNFINPEAAAVDRMGAEEGIPEDFPNVVFVPDKDFLNPAKQPEGEGRWEFLTDKDQAAAEKLMRGLAAADIWYGRFNGLLDLECSINIVWMPTSEDHDSFESEYQEFARRYEANERAQVNAVMLEIMDKYHAEARNASSAVHGSTNRRNVKQDALERCSIKGLYLQQFLCLGKTAQEGESAFYYDTTIQFSLEAESARTDVPRVSGVYLIEPLWSSMAYGRLRENKNSSLDVLGNPFSASETPLAPSSITSVVMVIGDAAHWVVFQIFFDAVSKSARCQLRNSGFGEAEGDGSDENKRVVLRAKQLAPILGAYLAAQPEVGLPNLTWNNELEDVPVTQQANTADCGPFAVKNALSCLYGFHEEVLTDPLEARVKGEEHRERCLQLFYEHVTDQQSEASKQEKHNVDRQALIDAAIAAKALINPLDQPKGLGYFAWLDPSEDGPDAVKAREKGLSSSSWTDVIEARLMGDIDSGVDASPDILPVSVWWPDLRYLNPPLLPLGAGRWEFLWQDDEKAMQPYTAEKVWQQRYIFGDRSVDLEKHKVVWIPEEDDEAGEVEPVNEKDVFIRRLQERLAAFEETADASDVDMIDVDDNTDGETKALQRRVQQLSNQVKQMKKKEAENEEYQRDLQLELETPAGLLLSKLLEHQSTN
ncbi:hypothetical protein KCU93_g10164, partial [Aureobasidium melanogenum]